MPLYVLISSSLAHCTTLRYQKVSYTVVIKFNFKRRMKTWGQSAEGRRQFEAQGFHFLVLNRASQYLSWKVVFLNRNPSISNLLWKAESKNYQDLQLDSMPLAVLDPASSTCCQQQWENKKPGYSLFFFLKLRLKTANLATNQDHRVFCVEII